METRTDIHRPSAIVPSQYAYVGIWTMNIQSFGEAEFMLRERKVCREHMDRTKGTLCHYSNGSCGICGNVQAVYLALFHHEASNEYIVVGVNCADKLDMGYDFKAMQLFKRRCADAREQQAGKRKAIALLDDAGLIDAWAIFVAEVVHSADCKAQGLDAFGDDNGAHHNCTCDFEARWKAVNQYEERTIRDIVGKLVRYGSISDAQKGFISKLLGNIVRRPIIEAERAAEREAAGPVPVGRVRMQGTVLSLKQVEAPVYGYSRYSNGPNMVTKVLIKLDNGSKVFGRHHSALTKGDRVDFIATVEASKDDPKFGFFKRAAEPKRELSKEEKKAVKRLKHVLKGVQADNGYQYAGYSDAYNDVWQRINAIEKGESCTQS